MRDLAHGLLLLPSIKFLGAAFPASDHVAGNADKNRIVREIEERSWPALRLANVADTPDKACSERREQKGEQGYDILTIANLDGVDRRKEKVIQAGNDNDGKKR